MSLINIEDDSLLWLSEFSSLERLSNTINGEISQRDDTTSVQEYNKRSAKVRILLKQFENEYIQLVKKLERSTRNITADEKDRRRRNLEQIASKKQKLDARFQNTASSSSRNQLFETAKKNKLFDDDDDDQPIIVDNESTSVETFRVEQKQIIKQQDDSLDALSKVISRQRNIAIRIGGEVDSQNDILDNIAVQLENTSVRVNSSTQQVENVADKSSSFGYWVVIISLFVAIILIGIL